MEKDVAEYIKKEFDKKRGPTWHCIVGKNFGNHLFSPMSCTFLLYNCSGFFVCPCGLFRRIRSVVFYFGFGMSSVILCQMDNG